MDPKEETSAPIELPRRRRRAAMVVLGHVAILLAGLFAVAAAWHYGMAIRKWTYESTDRFRHRYDIRHNLYFGTRAIDESVVDLYGNILKERSHGNYQLDYVPLRLLTMRMWAAWVREKYDPGMEMAQSIPYPVYRWEPQFEFTAPLLYFNAGMEAAAAIAIFLLIRLWIRRAAQAELDETLPLAPPERRKLGIWRGSLAGFAGAMLMWFSPASHISAQGWPSWDIWIIPFFLWTVFAGCVNWWFVSGMILAVGTMFKGQQLMVVGLFILWPLFMGKPGMAGRWIAGYLFAGAMIASPWLLRDGETRIYNTQAIGWVIGIVAAFCIVIAGKIWVKKWQWRTLTMVPLAGLIAWPLFLQQQWQWWVGGAMAIGLVVGLSWYLRAWWRQGYLAAGCVGAAIALCATLFNGDVSWWDISFRYGADKFAHLAMFNFNTLAMLLAYRFGWRSQDEPVFTIDSHALWLWPNEPFIVTIKLTLVALYAVALVLCAFAMARHTVRRDRHFLVAVAAIWVAAFAFMPQMHSRYLLFGASMGALLAGVHVGLVLIDLILIFLAWLMTIHLMMGANSPAYALEPYLGQEWGMPLFRFISRSIPDMAWGIMFIAVMLIYVALTPSRRSGKPGLIRRGIGWVKTKLRRKREIPETMSVAPASA